MSQALSLETTGKSRLEARPLRARQEGRIAIVTNVGAERGGRGAHTGRMRASRTAKSRGTSAADFEVPPEFAAIPYWNFKVVSGTGFKKLLLPCAFRSS